MWGIIKINVNLTFNFTTQQQPLPVTSLSFFKTMIMLSKKLQTYYYTVLYPADSFISIPCLFEYAINAV